MTVITALAVPPPDPDAVAAALARIMDAFARLVDAVRRAAAILVRALKDSIARWWPTLTRIAAAHRAEQRRVHVAYRRRQVARRRKRRG